MFDDKPNPNVVFFDKLMLIGKKLTYAISQPFLEIIYGVGKDTIPYFPILIWMCVFDFLNLTKFDKKIFVLLKIPWLYPTHFITYVLYVINGLFFAAWIWGAIQVNKRNRMIQKLTHVFQEAGLKSPMGRLPNFIFDIPVDENVRRLRVTSSFVPKDKFIEAKGRLESALQVYIDEVTENRASGTVDLLYSLYEIPKLIELKDWMSKMPNQFLVGHTRAKEIYSSLQETPHLLIGGQTGGGKSTFLRQLITSLYCNNHNYEFTLIDMKGGLEFQLFEKRDRISVASTFKMAQAAITTVNELIDERFALLKTNQCKDIDELMKIDIKDLVLPTAIKKENFKINRLVLVIDEAAELFLANGKGSVSDVQDLSRKVIRIAAQGRACGIHLVIATQKPDANAINTQVKANLTGIISFPMATLGASMSILGNGRAKDLPAIPGRSIWRCGLDQYEVQTPFISPEQVKIELDKVSPLKQEVVKNEQS